jgi:hypothetical protein
MPCPVQLANRLGANHRRQILRRRDREALKRLLCKNLFDNADTETQSKIQYALIERTLANTTDASPVLRRKIDTSPEYHSVMELGLPRTTSTSRPLKRNHATMDAGAVHVQDQGTPKRPARRRKLITTPQLAKQWERDDGSEFSLIDISLLAGNLFSLCIVCIYPPYDVMAQWCIDTRKGGRYEHLACFTSANFPIKCTLATKEPATALANTQGTARLLPVAVTTGANLPREAPTAIPCSTNQTRSTCPTITPIKRPAAARPKVPSRGSPTITRTTTTVSSSKRPFRPLTAAARISDGSFGAADVVKLRKRTCVKQRP